MDTNNSGSVSFSEFKMFWNDLVRASDVTLLHTLAEYENIISEESTSGRLVVLEVGFTYCKPCRAFEPTYHKFAKQFKDARFLRINGNDNQEMVRLGRDILKVKSSPSFYLFRNGEQTFKFTG
jgi:thioredoxin 1